MLTLFAVSIASASVEVYFSPKGGCTDAIVKQISKAVSTIDIAMYSFSSRPISSELLKAKDKGVKVRMLFDKGQQTQQYSGSRYLAKNGVSVKYDMGSGLMHNKFAVIDGKILVTGSFNWTQSAERKNRENLLILDDTALIKKYQAEFEKVWTSN